MIRIANIKMPLKHTMGDLKARTAKLLRTKSANIKDWRVTKKAIDARDKTKIVYVYSVDVEIENEDSYLRNKNVSLVKPLPKTNMTSNMTFRNPPVVVGSGPAGLFAALTLAKAGLNPLIIERGQDVDNRQKAVEHFFDTRELNEESNVQFGEGGAGTFSDGKLTTGTNDYRIATVLESFIHAGAPEEIAYLSKPHIGTDQLISVVRNLRKRIEALGGRFCFESKLVDFSYCDGQIQTITIRNNRNGEQRVIETEHVILAIGHSARDTFQLLRDKNIQMQSKAFAVGLRIEHKQSMINEIQYGAFAKDLAAADYKLVAHLNGGRSVYTFCMCPGGIVVPAASQKGHLVVNGMSNFARNADNANSAVLVSVQPSDFPSSDLFAGIAFQQMLEQKAFAVSNDYQAPVQLVGDFLAGKESVSLGDVQPSYAAGYVCTNLQEILPPFVSAALREGLLKMDTLLSGFAQHDSVLTGVETRSSSPVRLLRDASYQSNIRGLFPCGEGAGYAGGIMSAAVDGIKCAEALARIE